MTNAAVRPCPESAHQGRFLADVLEGLGSEPRAIPCKYFYDLEGSRLFDGITAQAEYYPTRAETDLLRTHAPSIARALGANVDLIELGSGSSTKTRLLLDALTNAVRYVPVDISAEHLRASARALQRSYPDLRIEPVVGDYSRKVEGVSRVAGSRRVVFFPGSSIGNFEPGEAVSFLRRARELAGDGGVLLIGVDLPKDRMTLERAYDDAAGRTAAFNLNLLHRMRRELGAEVEPADFRHAAVWQEGPSRIEMRLVARRSTTIRVGGSAFRFREGELIVTEHCYKHDVGAFALLGRRAGLTQRRVWLDPTSRVSMHWLDEGTERSAADRDHDEEVDA